MILERLKANQYRVTLMGVAALFSGIAGIGAIHSFLRGYSDIYTSIFILLAGGYVFIIYLLFQIKREIIEEKTEKRE